MVMSQAGPCKNCSVPQHYRLQELLEFHAAREMIGPLNTFAESQRLRKGIQQNALTGGACAEKWIELL